ncbi:MAG: hypothetical protein E6J34_24395 [Chloroflexi bacterium]|nr:MAG: hypothetical protein E6J34_24395 [Chloroflexota bacterium]
MLYTNGIATTSTKDAGLYVAKAEIAILQMDLLHTRARLIMAMWDSKHGEQDDRVTGHGTIHVVLRKRRVATVRLLLRRVACGVVQWSLF